MSCNHHGKYAEAEALVRAAKEAGADAIKLQTYTADTMTIACANKYFTIKGTIWAGRTLHDLYREAYTPWEWQPKLMKLAARLGLHCFSSPFDATAVDFLQKLKVPAYKVASFENGDVPLMRKIAATRKPVIVSTGMATGPEIDEAVRTLRKAGSGPVALLKCTSAYPAPPDDMNLRTIPDMLRRYGVPIGLSDHTVGHAAAVTAVALGASLIEKHLILSRKKGGPDAPFSAEPQELKALVEHVRAAERSLGVVRYGPAPEELPSRAFRRSIFVVKDVARGETYTRENVRCIRPGHGLHPRHFDEILGRRAAKTVRRGTPLDWKLVGDKP
ncbi:MAG: pseudaminic acid synthase [Elusimicrobia bacterium]|nr:pseudaminic acid synthase [Elusimicrobiota bacterium]